MSYNRVLIGWIFLTGCLSTTDHSVDLEEGIIQSQGFSLLTFHHLRPTQVVHVYIEGDGQPWINDQIAADPGPANLVALSLMKKDSSASFYLGRPCYFQLKIKPGPACGPSLWTRARYSRQVVNVLVKALLSQSDLNAYDEWVLVGHSGGGTLAYLMAQQLPKVKKVVAISSNLDVNAWVAYHHYAPLDQSLDPTAIEPAKPLKIFYLAGGKDVNVPLALNQHFLNQINAEIIIREEYDHSCCWDKEWPGLLQKLDLLGH